MIERAEGIGHIHPFTTLGCINLERIGETGRESHTAGQAYAHDSILEHIGMQAEGTITIEDILDASLFGKVVGHTHDGDHVLALLLYHQSLPFHDGCIHLDRRMLAQLL